MSRKIETGDFVKVIDNKTDLHNITVGKVYEVVDARYDGDVEVKGDDGCLEYMWSTEIELVEHKDFGLSDLVEDMIFETRNSSNPLEERTVKRPFDGSRLRCAIGYWRDFNEDLTNTRGSEYDIMRIYELVKEETNLHLIGDCGEMEQTQLYRLVWERVEEEIVEMTVDEISEKLGHKVKIVGGEN